MKIPEIAEIIRNRLNAMLAQRTQAVAMGDLDQVAKLDAAIEETQQTLNKLLTLAG